MKSKLFPYICWLTAITFSLQLQAQNKVSAPMADVNQVVDNTLDSLNKAIRKLDNLEKSILYY